MENAFGILVLLLLLCVFLIPLLVSLLNKVQFKYRNIIQKYKNEISGGMTLKQVENKVRVCIIAILQKEGNPSLAPNGQESLSEWETKANIPRKYLNLKDYLMQQFSMEYKKQKNELEIFREEEKKLKQKERDIGNERQQFIERNNDLVEKFLEIAERKVSVIDDYGDENWDVLSGEINVCMKKIAKREGKYIDWASYAKDKSDLPIEYKWLLSELNRIFLEYHKKQKSRESTHYDLNNMTGVEFETWIVKILKENGFNDVSGTPTSGDQGADLIAKINGKKIIIQAKRFKAPVGNKAVQEVISAIKYYGGDEGWVITNSIFTSSAKALAHKGKIKLIDGKSLSHIKDFID